MNLNDERFNLEKKTNLYFNQFSKYNYYSTTSTTINNVTEVVGDVEHSSNPYKQRVYEDFCFENRIISSDIIPTFLVQCDTCLLYTSRCV